MCHLPCDVCANNFLDLSCYKYLDNKIMWYSYKWTVDISSHCTRLCQTSTSAQAVGHAVLHLSWPVHLHKSQFSCFLLLDLSCLYVTTGISWNDVRRSCGPLKYHSVLFLNRNTNLPQDVC